jgi:hypothetical protein
MVRGIMEESNSGTNENENGYNLTGDFTQDLVDLCKETLTYTGWIISNSTSLRHLVQKQEWPLPNQQLSYVVVALSAQINTITELHRQYADALDSLRTTQEQSKK